MLIDVILCAAIAMLVLLIVWCLLGRLLLPVRPGAALVYWLAEDEPALERQVRAVNWLRSSGLFDGTLYLVCPGEDGASFAAVAALERQFPFVRCVKDSEWNERLRER